VTTFLIAVGTLCAICVGLSLVLVVADRYLSDYGRCRITINGGSRSLDVRGGQSLLNALGGEKIFIPSACGGRGTCGLCKLRVRSGGGPVLPTEDPHLTADERRDGVRLSCQVKVRNDLDIEIPEHLFSVREFAASVETMEDLTYDTKRVRLALVAPPEIAFVPGQYIQLQCPAYGDNPEPVYRAYSLSSDPADPRHAEMLIRLVPKGICTTWVFTRLKPGTPVTFNGPYGDFRLHDGTGEMIFIAGGSGMAPFCSILAAMRQAGNPRPTRYFFGAKAVRDLFLLDEMKRFESDLPDFRFIPALSAPDPTDLWNGERGLITDVVGRHYPDCRDKQAYLCGSPGMIDACINVLSGRGMPPENIFYDKFA